MNNAEIIRLQKFMPYQVFFFCVLMYFTIHLYYQLGSGAIKIHDESFNAVLTPEPVSLQLTVTQTLPE
jgi:hypothetical protein